MNQFGRLGYMSSDHFVEAIILTVEKKSMQRNSCKKILAKKILQKKFLILWAIRT